MKNITEKHFGVIIAFLLPGFLFLWGLSYSSPQVATWLATSSGSNAPTVGGFLYATLASLAAGLIINAIRWAIVQELLLYGVTRLPRPIINYEKLTNKDVLAAFEGAIEGNYRYYQYYSNAFAAVVGAIAFYLWRGVGHHSWLVWAALVIVLVILFFASRNELKVFNQRGQAITQ